jgi:AcrR family transcriptional regulator
LSTETPASPSTPPPRLRADAQRNRDRLLAAARSAFSTASNDADAVSLEGIARSAGVGIGTLYRNFPTREALIEALYRAELDEVTALAPTLLARNSAIDALGLWIERYGEFVVTKHGMQNALQIAWTTTTAPVSGTRTRVTGTIAEFLAAGARDGTIRDDLEADDVTASFVGAFIATRSSSDPGQVRRVLAIIVDGLRPRA